MPATLAQQVDRRDRSQIVRRSKSMVPSNVLVRRVVEVTLLVIFVILAALAALRVS
jgi:hypothetical protein